MHISELFSQDEYEVINAKEEIRFDRLESEPERVGENCLFFLLPGVFHDEMTYLPYVLSQKPAAVVVDTPQEIRTDVPIVIVKNVRRSFAFACYRSCGVDKIRIPIVGVTGTNGKTTVANEIVRVLEKSGKKTGYIGTGKITTGGLPYTDPYYGMTTPDPPLLYASLAKMKNEGCDAVVMEVSSHALALEKVAPIRFSVAVFTGLSEEHLDFHKDMENYFRAKEKLFAQTDAALICIDGEYGKRLYESCPCGKKSVSAIGPSDIKAAKIESKGLSGTRFLYEEKETVFPLETPLPGDFQVVNALLCAGACLALQVPVQTVKEAIKTMPVVPGRMEKVAEVPTVYLDYAHTPESLKTALKILYSNKTVGQKIILVFGCGGERDKLKRPVMASVAEKYADFVYVTSDNSRGENPLYIFRDIESGFTSDRHRSVYSRERAIAMAIENANDADIVLVEGKGDEPYIKDKHGIRPYRERKVIADAVERRNGGAKLFYENPSVRSDPEL